MSRYDGLPTGQVELLTREARKSCGDTGLTLFWPDPNRDAYLEQVEAEAAAINARLTADRPDWFRLACSLAANPFAATQMAATLRLDAGMGDG